MCVYVCVRACVRACVCVMQDVSKTKNLFSLEQVAVGHEKACGSKCCRNGTLSYVKVLKDIFYNIIPTHLSIQF